MHPTYILFFRAQEGPNHPKTHGKMRLPTSPDSPAPSHHQPSPASEDCGTGPAETTGLRAEGRAEGGGPAGRRGGATEREATTAGTEGKAGWDGMG